MNLPETAGATRPSLVQDWIFALRYWLRGPKGIAVLVVSALVLGAALNWSWLVAVGIAPLLLTVLPCAVMCGLGLCMNRITGGSCSTSSSATDHPDAPMTNIAPRTTAVAEPEEPSVSLTAEVGPLQGPSTVGAVGSAPDQQSQILNGRE